jgi:hypothetical protein
MGIYVTNTVKIWGSHGHPIILYVNVAMAIPFRRKIRHDHVTHVDKQRMAGGTDGSFE